MISLGSLSQIYNGTARPATAGTTPIGLTVNLTYNGSANAPTNAGGYTVIGTINNANYQGGATNTLVISPATGVVTLGNLSQTYDGTAKAATAGTTPTRVDGQSDLQRFGQCADERGQLHGDWHDQ